MEDLAEKVDCTRFSNTGWENTSTHVPVEKRISISVNGQEFVNLLCTPNDLNFLVIGYLYGEGVISGISDVVSIDVCEDESEVDVRLSNPEVSLPEVRTLTSGCTGGVAFKAEGEKVESDLVISPEDMLSLMKQEGQVSRRAGSDK
jgi:FdhD protein